MRSVKPEQTKGPAGGNRQIPASDLGMDAESSRFFIACFLHVKSFLGSPRRSKFLDLHLLEAVLPDGGVGGDTILTEVNQDVPKMS
jgi:hypothetical protein